MKKIYILFFLFALTGISASAQTLAQAKALYAKGEYEQAKPTFQKLVKQQPANGNYNLWYGVCCLKTGEADAAIAPLQTAVKKRVTGGQFYLGQAYHAIYRFKEAIATYEAYIADLTKLKRSTEEAERLLEESKTQLRYLKGVEKVCFIDSMVVDKQAFLEAYRLGTESGKLSTYNDYFGKEDSLQTGTVYETEIGNRLYYAMMQGDGTHKILTSNKMQGEWAVGRLLPGGINGEHNANFPYMLTDGITLYYAADGKESMGGYDIFVTRYNSSTDTYLTPENIGMPFNSPYNDYMFAIDEYNNLGWFASDRYQPEGKVCIYVFIPNTTKHVYDYESMDAAKIVRLGRLTSIAESQTDELSVTQARERLTAVTNEKAEVKKHREFEFIIDDARTYHQLADFRSQQAKDAFNHYRILEKNYSESRKKLDGLRTSYARANQADKARLTPAILDLEKHLEQQREELAQMAVKVRSLEKKTIK